MQLTPRYGVDPIVVMDGDPSAILAPAVRQRRRLAEVLASFTDEQWANPSRCAGWSARDVIVHLDSTNAFWSFAIASGLQGRPTTFLATFDPVATPAEMVSNTPAMPHVELLERFTTSTEALVDSISALDDDSWTMLAEAPPGHIAISAVVHHALWDSWVHERDILVPLGISPAEEGDEIAACLRYAAALSPALAMTRGNDRTGVLAVSTTDPTVEFSVHVEGRVEVRAGTAPGDPHLTGGSIELLEALSQRRPLDRDVPPDTQWMLAGLAQVFDTEPG